MKKLPLRSVVRLKKRQDFVRVARIGRKAVSPALILQFYRRNDPGPIRVGYTVSKKVGNAVVRNKVRRRLREVVRLLGFPEQLTSADIVLIGRRGTEHFPFFLLVEAYQCALQKCLTPRPSKTQRRSSKHRRRSV